MRTAVVLGVLGTVGLVTRLLTLRWGGTLNADEAVAGLMALHIATGQATPVFYYGQHYFGALEAYLLAGLFKGLGFHPWLLYVPPMAASLALIPLTIALSRRLVSDEPNRDGLSTGCWLAGLPIAAATPIMARMLVNAGGGFALALALQGATLLCYLCAFGQRASLGRTVRWTAAFSLAAGVLCWVWQPALVLVPVLLVALFIRHPALLFPRRLSPAVLPLLVGLWPPLAYNVTSGFPTVVTVLQKAALGPSEAPAAITSSPFAIPILLGMALGGGEDTYGGTNWLQTGAVGAALLVVPVVAWLRRPPGAGGAGLNRPAIGILFLAFATNVAVAHGTVRHLHPAALIAFALFGALPAACSRGATRLALSGGLAVLIVVPNLWLLPHAAGAYGARPPFGTDVRAVLHALAERGLTHGYSDYWTAYPLTYVAGERIIVAPAAPTIWGEHFDRYPRYTQLVDAGAPANKPFLLLDARCSVAPYVQPLEAAGATFRVERVTTHTLLWDIQAPGTDVAATLAAWRAAIASPRPCLPLPEAA